MSNTHRAGMVNRLNAQYRRALVRLSRAMPGTAAERRALALVRELEEKAAVWSLDKGQREPRGLVLGCRPGYIAVWVEIGLFLLACACLLVLAGSARGAGWTYTVHDARTGELAQGVK